MPWLLFFQNLRWFCASICVYNETVLSLNFHPKKRRIFFSFIPARGIRILIIKILAVELNYSDRETFQRTEYPRYIGLLYFQFFSPTTTLLLWIIVSLVHFMFDWHPQNNKFKLAKSNSEKRERRKERCSLIEILKSKWILDNPKKVANLTHSLNPWVYLLPIWMK